MNKALRLRNHEDYAKSFDDCWTAATDACAQLETDPVAQKIKTFRNKYHAHLEMAPLGEDPGPFKVSSLGLTYNDILDFADRYRDAVFQLVRVLTGSVHDVEGFSSIHRKCGEDMWRILAVTSPTTTAGE